ncbi:hypothetical protein [Algibacter sp. R77976]|uniref:hypothetical protein n=1 Tax=Algibacter sp. R77976 TaxID=3093873 RepID=UPI0037CCA212
MRFICLFLSFSFLLAVQTKVYSQVGMGTTNPNPSSILDITSTTKGVLIPRMTTAQRNLIGTPAEGLLVFDINEDAFYYYDTTATTWVKLEGSVSRDNYKLVKSAADLADELAAGGGTEYLFTDNFLYEINGTINLAVPINLNEAYVVGRDANEDVLVSAGGTIFSGSQGGSIQKLTLSAPGGTVFNLSGSGAESLIFRDCIVAGSNSVGSISNFNLVFTSIVQYVNNTNGVVYADIKELLLNSTGWFGNNSGVYETFSGDFDIITKQGGFSNVVGATAALDVTGITSINGAAGIRIVDFYGGGNYINGNSPYAGYNFTNDWDINCPGILVETDGVATGDINLNYPIGSGAVTSFSGTGAGSRTKVIGTTTSNNLFRFTSSTDNRIVYDGKKTRYFGVFGSLSFQGNNNNAIFIFYIAKNGVVVPNTRVYREVGGNNDVGAVSIVGSIQLTQGDYIEVWAERFTGSGNLLTVSLNVIAE